jgi:hypothetical protein
MNSNQLLLNEIRSSQADTPYPASLFSLKETSSHYFISLDLPTMPAVNTEILSKVGERRNDLSELIVQGQCTDALPHSKKQTFFRCLSQKDGIQAIYKDGILWVLLSKDDLHSLTFSPEMVS